NVEPDGGVHVTGTTPSTRSLAVAVNVATAPDELDVMMVTGPGSVNAGAVVSTTWTTNVFGTATLPWESVAVHVTVVLPTEKTLPDAGAPTAVATPSTTTIG